MQKIALVLMGLGQREIRGQAGCKNTQVLLYKHTVTLNYCSMDPWWRLVLRTMWKKNKVLLLYSAAHRHYSYLFNAPLSPRRSVYMLLYQKLQSNLLSHQVTILTPGQPVQALTTQDIWQGSLKTCHWHSPARIWALSPMHSVNNWTS